MGGGGGGLALFLFKFFEARNYFTLCKIVLCIQREKKNLFATIILRQEVIVSCLKMNLKISHKLR